MTSCKPVSFSRTPHYAVNKTYKGKSATNSLIFDLGTEGRLLINLGLWPLCPPRMNAGVHGKGGWLGPTARLHFLKKNYIFCPHRDSNPGASISLDTYGIRWKNVKEKAHLKDLGLMGG